MARAEKTREGRRGFSRAGALLQGQIRSAGESRGFAVSRVLTHWAEIVGADLASLARPVDVKYGREGGLGATLTVLTTGAQAPIMEMRKEELRGRVNAAYGYNAIARVRVTQTAATGFAEGQVAFDAKPKAAAPLSPELTAKAHESAAPIGDANLRAALETLAKNVLSREGQSRKDKP